MVVRIHKMTPEYLVKIIRFTHWGQGRIQDLKLGVAQMDGKIKKLGYFFSVTLFFHGALLQSKTHRYKEHIYTHS